MSNQEDYLMYTGGHSLDQNESQPDLFLNPPHYRKGKIEAITYMKDNMDRDAYLGYLEGCAKKYMHRWTYKGQPVQDIGKAIWYLSLLKEELEGEL